MERVAATAPFNYQLIREDGEVVGELASVESSWTPGDLVPFGGSIYELVAVDGNTWSVRKVL